MYSLAFSSLCLIKYIKMFILTNEFSWPLYEFSITAMANYHNLRDTSLLSPVFVGQKSDSGAIGLNQGVGGQGCVPHWRFWGTICLFIQGVGRIQIHVVIGLRFVFHC